MFNHWMMNVVCCHFSQQWVITTTTSNHQVFWWESICNLLRFELEAISRPSVARPYCRSSVRVCWQKLQSSGDSSTTWPKTMMTQWQNSPYLNLFVLKFARWQPQWCWVPIVVSKLSPCQTTQNPIQQPRSCSAMERDVATLEVQYNLCSDHLAKGETCDFDGACPTMQNKCIPFLQTFMLKHLPIFYMFMLFFSYSSSRAHLTSTCLWGWVFHTPRWAKASEKVMKDATFQCLWMHWVGISRTESSRACLVSKTWLL